MQEEIRVWLEDIEKSIVEIESFLPTPKIFEEFKKDLKGKRAIERNIEIIGEAMNRILRLDSTINLSDTRKIVDTRNRILHGYDSVSDEIIWLIVIKYLPILLKQVIELKNSK